MENFFNKKKKGKNKSKNTEQKPQNVRIGGKIFPYT